MKRPNSVFFARLNARNRLCENGCELIITYSSVTDVLRDDDLCGGVGLQSPLSRHVSSPGSLASVVMKASEPASDSQHSVELAGLENATTAAFGAGVSPNRIFGAVYAALEKAGATDLGHNPAEFGLLPVIGSPNLLLGFCSSLLFHICGVGLWGLASSVGGTLLGMLVGIAYSGFLFFRGRYLSRQDGGRPTPPPTSTTLWAPSRS